MSHSNTDDAMLSHPLGLGGLCEDQCEKTQTHFLMLLLTFTHLTTGNRKSHNNTCVLQ